MKNNIIQVKSYEFSLKIIGFLRYYFHDIPRPIQDQLLRSGTSIGANIEEALAGYSRADFINKMSIALKESRETFYWLRLVRDSRLVSAEKLNALIHDSEEILKILISIVKSSRSNNS